MAAIFILTERNSRETRQVVMNGFTLSIGKSEDNDLVLDRPAISRRHCQIESHGAGLMVRDVGSRNGTYLDGRRLEPQVAVPLAPGQVIQLGDFSLVLTETPHNPNRPPPTPGAVRRPRHTDTAVAPPPAPPRQVTPVELKRQVHSLLLERMDLKHTDMSNRSAQEIRALTEQVCTQIVQEMAGRLPPWLMPAALVKEVVDEAVGLGLLEDLLADETVDEIMVCGWDKVYVERYGK
ncbi:MAG: FHA domain-containing protein, partial [Planctomycetota bacterium]|nr:FHA domain-containing protein [Planctomycetota bacterium]